MANLAASAILTAIEEVLDGELGTVRTFALTDLSSNTYPSLPAEEKARRAMIKPRFDVNITDVRRHPASPPEKSNKAFYLFDVSIALEYKLEHEAIEDDRRAIRAQALLDSEKARQALGWPGNLTLTDDGTATGIVSGLLTFKTSSPVSEDFERRLLTRRLEFEGVANVTMATS